MIFAHVQGKLEKKPIPNQTILELEVINNDIELIILTYNHLNPFCTSSTQL